MLVFSAIGCYFYLIIPVTDIPICITTKGINDIISYFFRTRISFGTSITNRYGNGIGHLTKLSDYWNIFNCILSGFKIYIKTVFFQIFIIFKFAISIPFQWYVYYTSPYCTGDRVRHFLQPWIIGIRTEADAHWFVIFNFNTITRFGYCTAE